MNASAASCAVIDFTPFPVRLQWSRTSRNRSRLPSSVLATFIQCLSSLETACLPCSSLSPKVLEMNCSADFLVSKYWSRRLPVSENFAGTVTLHLPEACKDGSHLGRFITALYRKKFLGESKTVCNRIASVLSSPRSNV